MMCCSVCDMLLIRKRQNYMCSVGSSSTMIMYCLFSAACAAVFDQGQYYPGSITIIFLRSCPLWLLPLTHLKETRLQYIEGIQRNAMRQMLAIPKREFINENDTG